MRLKPKLQNKCFPNRWQGTKLIFPVAQKTIHKKLEMSLSIIKKHLQNINNIGIFQREVNVKESLEGHEFQGKAGPPCVVKVFIKVCYKKRFRCHQRLEVNKIFSAPIVTINNYTSMHISLHGIQCKLPEFI